MFGPEHDLKVLSSINWEEVAADPTWQREHLAYHFFFESLLKVECQNGWTIEGCSFSQRGANTLLVVKATHEETPLVAYCTEKTPTGCVVAFSRAYIMDRVRWHADKFRRT